MPRNHHHHEPREARVLGSLSLEQIARQARSQLEQGRNTTTDATTALHLVADLAETCQALACRVADLEAAARGDDK